MYNSVTNSGTVSCYIYIVSGHRAYVRYVAAKACYSCLFYLSS
jgi:hypothetical protein